MRFPLYLLLAALTMTTAAWAYPNLNATSGILAVPTAVVVPAGDTQWAGDVLFQDDTTINGRVTYGLTDRLEVGAGVIIDGDTVVGLNAKYRLPGDIGGFTWAAGATLITGSDVDDGFQIYAAGTRPIPWGSASGMALLGTIGVNFTDIDTASAVRPFIGAQLQLGTGTEIGAEFVFETGDFNESISSLLLRHRFNDFISGQVGFTNAFGFTGTQDHDIFLGVAFTGREAR
jgi:hypothetical protein